MQMADELLMNPSVVDEEFEVDDNRMNQHRDKKSRAFVFTVPNVESEDGHSNLDHLIAATEVHSYLLVGPVETAPTTGMRHCHGVMQLFKETRISTLINKFPGVWFDVRKARVFQKAVDYCVKEGPAAHIIGDPPSQDGHLKGVFYNGELIKDWALDYLSYCQSECDFLSVMHAQELVDFIEGFNFCFDEFMDTLLYDVDDEDCPEESLEDFITKEVNMN